MREAKMTLVLSGEARRKLAAAYRYLLTLRKGEGSQEPMTTSDSDGESSGPGASGGKSGGG